MWPEGVVRLPPSFDQDLSLLEGVEDLAVKEFISQLAVEGFIVAVLPRAAPIFTGTIRVYVPATLSIPAIM